MRKRTNNPRSTGSLSSGGGNKSFRKSSGPSSKRSKPEVESRFSKPSIKKSSLRIAQPENKAPKVRPSFDHEKPASDRPRFDRERRDFGKAKPFGGQERFRRNDDGREEKKPFGRSEHDRSFGPRDQEQARGKKTFSDRRFSERSEKPRFEKSREFNLERRTSDEKGGSRDFRESRGRDFSENRTSREFREERASRPGRTPRRDDQTEPVDRSGLERRVGRFETAPRYNLKDYENKNNKDKKKRTEETDDIRLNRYIANAGICSRREADDLISSGQISVNGKTVTEMGYKVKLTDVVKYGKKALNPEKMVYILINKPKDYITTTDDPEERKTVIDLIQGACSERVYPVGRLDRNTTGLLLMTNDGELAEKLTHPSSGIKKIYQAELDKPITTEDFEALQRGVELEDGFIRPDEVGIVTPDAMVVGLEIHSGRNRIVRRMFEHLGYEVQKLDRTVFAGLNKKDLPRGKWRFLTEKEVIKLKFLL